MSHGQSEHEGRRAEDENHTSPLGSDTWSNEPRYENIYRARLDFVLDKVSEAALQELVSSLRNGMRCTISGHYAAGNFNLVKKIVFDDDVQWIIRIRLPPLSYFTAGTPRREASYSETEVRGSRIICTERDLESLKSEIVTMKYLRFDLPFPEKQTQTNTKTMIEPRPLFQSQEFMPIPFKTTIPSDSPI